jgi:hypothetical protein
MLMVVEGMGLLPGYRTGEDRLVPEALKRIPVPSTENNINVKQSQTKKPSTNDFVEGFFYAFFPILFIK